MKLIASLLILLAGWLSPSADYGRLEWRGDGFVMFLSGEVYRSQDLETWVKDEPKFSKADIQRLASSGELCRAIGHRWESLPYTTLEYRADGNYPQTRRCSICGWVEQRQMGEWK